MCSGRQPPGERLGGGQVALVAERDDRRLAHAQRLDRDLAGVRRHAGRCDGIGLGVVDLEPEPGGVVELVPATRQVDERDAVQAVGRDHVVAGREVPAVDDQQDVRRGRPFVGPEPRAVAQVGRQDRREVGQRRRDHPGRSDGIALLGALGVRKPLDPVPVGEVLLAAQHRDDQVARGVERRRRADQRPGHRARLLLGAADLDAVEGAQVDARGQVGLDAVDHEQPVQRRRGRRVDLVDRRAVGWHEVDRQGLCAQAVAHVQEARVAGGVLPDPRALVGEGRQGRRLGVVPGEGAALLVGRLAGDLADAGEVAEVLRA